MKLLIIEDEHDLSQSIADFLKSEDYLCEQAFNYQEALMKLDLYSYDCILLDLMLPGGNGNDVDVVGCSDHTQLFDCEVPHNVTKHRSNESQKDEIA